MALSPGPGSSGSLRAGCGRLLLDSYVPDVERTIDSVSVGGSGTLRLRCNALALPDGVPPATDRVCDVDYGLLHLSQLAAHEGSGDSTGFGPPGKSQPSVAAALPFQCIECRLRNHVRGSGSCRPHVGTYLRFSALRAAPAGVTNGSRGDRTGACATIPGGYEGAARRTADVRN